MKHFVAMCVYIYIFLYTQKTGPFCDVINTGIKPKFNWWSGYDLLRRLIFVTLYFAIEVTNKGDYTKV